MDHILDLLLLVLLDEQLGTETELPQHRGHTGLVSLAISGWCQFPEEVLG